MKLLSITTMVFVLELAIITSCTQNTGSASLPPEAGNPSGGEFSYNAYEDLLSRFVNEKGMVDYAALQQDRDRLDQFSRQLGDVPDHTYETWSSAEQLAFWINTYNALTLQVIVDHYPIKAGFFRSFVYPANSIRQIPGVWDRLRFTVLGRSLTLDEIEHEIIRQEFEEPRIHMALVCAAMGCPPLRKEPYRGVILESQLADQTRSFLADPDKFRIDHASDTVYLSSIFDWYGEDFMDKHAPETGFNVDGTSPGERAVLNFISTYLSPPEADYLKRGRYEIAYLDYDWSLNEQ